MKVILATPNFHQPRGNTVTVKRIADELESFGVETEIISITEDHDITSLPEADIIHGFHAYRFYKFIEKLDVDIDQYLVTMTGTDLNHDLFDQVRRKDVIRSLTGAKAIHVFDEKAKQTLMGEVPVLKDKIHIVPQGISAFPDSDYHLQKEEGSFLFVLPAGIRSIKNIPFAIEMLKTLHYEYPNIRLWLVGPVIEVREGQIVDDLVKKNSDWVRYIGGVPHEKMGAIYKLADVMLNTSHSEGQSSAILEAMKSGLPVLVSGNQGNRNLVTHEKTGYVYNDTNQFLDFAKRLVNNIEIREKLGQAAKQSIEESRSGKSEGEELLKIYKTALNKS